MGGGGVDVVGFSLCQNPTRMKIVVYVRHR